MLYLCRFLLLLLLRCFPVYLSAQERGFYEAQCVQIVRMDLDDVDSPMVVEVSW